MSITSAEIAWTLKAHPPATEANIAHWLSWAVEGYIAGHTDIDEFEQAVDDALHGRYVNFNGSPSEAHTR